MNNLFPHIEYLLLRHDCVIVPGLGAFISTFVPARIDMGNCRILPPSRSVMFNQAVTTDDGLLANSYVRRHNVSFEEARQLIVRDIRSLKETLEANGETNCGRLGKFILGEEGNLTFSPATTAVEAAENIGYWIADMQEESVKETVLPAVNATPVENTVSDQENTITPADRNYYYFRISKTFLRIASAVAVILAVALTVILNPVPRDSREQRASVVPVDALIPAVDKKNAVADTMTLKNPAVETKEPHIPAHYLIVATFSSRDEAESYVAAYSTEEFPLSTVSSKKMTRVAIASSDDRDSLRMKLNSSPISRKYPQAWIWSRL